MLLKDAKQTLRSLVSGTAGARVDFHESSSLVARIQVKAESNHELALLYVVRGGKGAASVFAWGYVTLWSLNSFAESGYQVEPPFLAELPASARPGIIYMRNNAVHQVAFMSTHGTFTSEIEAFRPEVQVIGWSNEQLRTDFTETLTHARALGERLPSPAEIAALLSRRLEARRRLRRNEA